MSAVIDQAVRHYIGSSDSAAAIGLNPYVTQVELWQEKRGLVPPFPGNAPTKWGKLLEPAVRQEYAEQTGRVVRLPPELLVHPTIPYMVCHPDGITDDARYYEGKTARYPDGWGEPGTDQVPDQYMIQVQHGMLVAALALDIRIYIADVAVLIGGQDFRLYHIERDPELQASIVEAEREFWQHVIDGTQPPVDISAPGAVAVLKKLYPGTNGQTVRATDEMQNWRASLEEAQAAGKRDKAAEEHAKAALLEFMGEASVLQFTDGRAMRRALIQRKGYTVEPAEYIDVRFIGKAKPFLTRGPST